MLPTPEHLPLPEAARSLVAASTHGALATLDPRAGHPYASLVEALALPGGDVVFFLSSLAAHTTNLTHDRRASLLVEDPRGAAAPLAHERCTLMGEIHVVEDRAAHRDAFLTRHPGASTYIDFSDFSFFRLYVERARYIAGFGRMDWLDAHAYATAPIDPVATSRAGIIGHMNEDHGANLLDYAHAFAGVEDGERARMLSIDRLGLDIEVHTPHSAQRVRVMFDAPLEDASRARGALVKMAGRARDVLGDAARAKAPGAH